MIIEADKLIPEMPEGPEGEATYLKLGEIVAKTAVAARDDSEHWAVAPNCLHPQFAWDLAAAVDKALAIAKGQEGAVVRKDKDTSYIGHYRYTIGGALLLAEAGEALGYAYDTAHDAMKSELGGLPLGIGSAYVLNRTEAEGAGSTHTDGCRWACVIAPNPFVVSITPPDKDESETVKVPADNGVVVVRGKSWTFSKQGVRHRFANRQPTARHSMAVEIH